MVQITQMPPGTLVKPGRLADFRTRSHSADSDPGELEIVLGEPVNTSSLSKSHHGSLVKRGRLIDPRLRHQPSNDSELEGLEVVGRAVTPQSSSDTESWGSRCYAIIARSQEESQVLGVSVAFLADGFMQEVEGHFGVGADPNYIELNPVMLFGPSARGAGFLCPRDGLPGCSYVDALDDNHTAPATVMLSWCWRYSVRTVVGALVRWCERTGRDPAQTFVWQCAVCCNQFRVEETKARGESEPFEVFQEVFESRVRATMHVLALLDPWDTPLYIWRIWCIFEFWKALNTEGCELEVVLPEAEEERFKEALRSDGMMAIWKVFEKLRIQDAQASVEADRVNILRLVDPDAKSSEDYNASEKCAQVNRDVIQRLQWWCVDTAAAHATAQIAAGNAFGRSSLYAGVLLMEVAEWERAEAVLEGARKTIEESGGANTPQHIALLRHLADLRNRQGRHEEASDMMEQVVHALEAESQTNLGDTRCNFLRRRWCRRSEYAASLCSAAQTCNLQGQLVEAVELYRRSQHAYEAAGAAGTPAYAGLLTELSGCLVRQGHHEEAEGMIAQARAIFEADGFLSPDDAEVLKVLGRCRLLQGRHVEAMEVFTRARCIFEDTGSARSVGYGALLLLMGWGRLEQGDVDEAKEFFAEATAVMEDIGATGRLEYASLPMFHGKVHLWQGDATQAMRLFTEARDGIESAGAVQTPEYAWLLLAMGKCRFKQGQGAEAMELFSQSRAAFEAAGAAAAFAQLVLVSL